MTNIKQQLKEALSEYFASIPENGGLKRGSFNNKVLLTKKEVALIYGISLNTVDKWIKRQLLPNPIKKASRIFFCREQVFNQLINKNNG